MSAVKLSKLQREYFTQLATEKNRVERDLMIAASVVLAGDGIDMVQGMTFNFDGQQLVYEAPKT